MELSWKRLKLLRVVQLPQAYRQARRVKVKGKGEMTTRVEEVPGPGALGAMMTEKGNLGVMIVNLGVINLGAISLGVMIANLGVMIVVEDGSVQRRAHAHARDAAESEAQVERGKEQAPAQNDRGLVQVHKGRERTAVRAAETAAAARRTGTGARREGAAAAAELSPSIWRADSQLLSTAVQSIRSDVIKTSQVPFGIWYLACSTCFGWQSQYISPSEGEQVRRPAVFFMTDTNDLINIALHLFILCPSNES